MTTVFKFDFSEQDVFFSLDASEGELKVLELSSESGGIEFHIVMTDEQTQELVLFLASDGFAP